MAFLNSDCLKNRKSEFTKLHDADPIRHFHYHKHPLWTPWFSSSTEEINMLVFAHTHHTLAAGEVFWQLVPPDVPPSAY